MAFGGELSGADLYGKERGEVFLGESNMSIECDSV